MQYWHKVARQAAGFIVKNCENLAMTGLASLERKQIKRRTKILDWNAPKAKGSRIRADRVESARLTLASMALLVSAMPTFVVILH